MSPRSPRKLDHDAPGRKEMWIVVVTIYAIVVSILACELVTRVQGQTETKSYASRYKTHNV
jgi:hypothetical protein